MKTLKYFLVFTTLFAFGSCSEESTKGEGDVNVCENSDLNVTYFVEQDDATLIVSGGTPPFSFMWPNGITANTATNLQNGSYTVVVTDSNGCSETVDVIIDFNPGDCSGISTYPEVTIGSQVWLQINLDVCHYRNGDPIPHVQDAGQWASMTTGAWCYYQNETVNGPVYGKLYNLYAVFDPRGLAPEGYRIADNQDWDALSAFLGGSGLAGGAMKSTSGWTAPNAGATNSSNFTALPGGTRNYDGQFLSDEGSTGTWWSATPNDGSGNWYRSIFFSQTALHTANGGLWTDGRSVRCVKE